MAAFLPDRCATKRQVQALNRLHDVATHARAVQHFNVTAIAALAESRLDERPKQHAPTGSSTSNAWYEGDDAELLHEAADTRRALDLQGAQ